MQVLDYSAGRPGAAAVRKAGYGGAVRYIGFPHRAKCTTVGELDDFTKHGLGMALVYEDNSGDWLGGKAQGVAAGHRAREHATAIGFPKNRPIYMAVDRDVVGEMQLQTMVHYLWGANASLGGPHLTGVYGEHDVCERAAMAGVAGYFWQTTAWSHHVEFPGRHLLQLVGEVQVNGFDCDVNQVVRDDWGQHDWKLAPPKPIPPLKPIEETDMRIIDCIGMPALVVFGDRSHEQITVAERDALRSAGVPAEAVTKEERATLLALLDKN